MIKRYEDIVLNIHGKAGDEERADYILALCRITQLICQLYQPEQDTKWQKLKEWVSFTQPKNINDEFISGACSAYSNVKDKMQELEQGEKDDNG